MHEGATYDGINVGQSMLNLRTDPLDYQPEVKHPIPEVDRFFYLAETGELLDGSVQDLPSLKGASGSSIWFCSDLPELEIWSPSKALSVIGVQSSQAPQRWARGVDWIAVAEIFNSSELGLTNPPSI